MTPTASWSASAVARAIGVSESTLGSWIRADLLRPAVFGRGRGGHRMDRRALLETVLVAELLAVGFALAEIRSGRDALLAAVPDLPPARLFLAVVRARGVWTWGWEDGVACRGRPARERPRGCALFFLPVGERWEQLLRDLGAAP